MATATLALHFVRREIRNRYLGSLSGGFWAVLQPLIQLAVYSVVFVYIFKTAAPEGSHVGYVPFLFMGLWPWTMFAESLSRATTVIQDNSALIGKVSIPREVLVFATVAGSFVVQIVGFVCVCVVLRVVGIEVDLLAMPVAFVVFVQMFFLALGFAYLFAGIQVFVRDLSSALPQLLMIWMFASPILYARSSLPELGRRLLDFNPFAVYPEMFRALLLQAPPVSGATVCINLAVTLAIFAIGFFSFRRLGPHFEDFL